MKDLAGVERIGGSKKTASGMLPGVGAAVVASHHRGQSKGVSPFFTGLIGLTFFLVCWSMLSFARAGGQTDRKTTNGEQTKQQRDEEHGCLS